MSLHSDRSSSDIDNPHSTITVGPDHHSGTSDSDKSKQDLVNTFKDDKTLSDDHHQDTNGTDSSGNNLIITEDHKPSRTANSQDNCGLKHLNPNIRFSTWGIFVTVYEVSSGLFPSSFAAYKEPSQSYLRLLEDLWGLCKWHCVQYYACNLWLALGPSVSLCFASSIVFNTGRLLRLNGLNEALKEGLDSFFRYQIVGWLMCGLLTFYAERNFTESRVIIGSHLRAHFLPKLVKASFEIDRKHLTERDGPFPASHEFADYIPALESFEEVLIRVRCIVSVALEVVSMAVIIRHLEEPFDRYAMSCLAILFFITTLFAPQHGAGGKNFGFVTWNEHFKRMHVLFSIAFDYQFCRTLSRDGLAGWFADEYKRSASALGIVKDIIGILTWGPPPPWYWELARTVLTKYSMELSALLIFWAPSSSIITTIIIFQYAISTLQGNIASLNGSGQRGSLILSMMVAVDNLYRLLDIIPVTGGSMDFPTTISEKGASIELKNVSCTYPLANDPAIDRVDLSIKAGQLIVITGVNGSGKSTLINLISGHIQPTSGDILVDENEIQLYNRGQLRKATTLVSQTEFIYYTSLRENLLLGTPNGPSQSVSDEDLDEAALLGGSLDLIRKHGYDTVLSPSNLPNTSVRGYPDKPVLDLLNKMDRRLRPTLISPGEQQRIIASRAFFRLKHGNIKLIILDEIANALDTTAEAKVFENFRDIAKRNGQTLIVVTHRLTNIAKQADLIVCMSKGKIAEQGTHQDLVVSGGEYASLYNAQALN